jgi:hypothetical protein
MNSYEAPTAVDLGRLTDVTLGGQASRCDGHSGSVGNQGVGGGGCEDMTP